MATDTLFKAPWSMSLILITSISCLILLGVVILGLLTGPENNVIWFLAMIVLPIFILIATACFSVRGYVLDGSALYVQRLGWNSKIGLQNLVTAEVDPQAMNRSLRTWGNGGLFSFTGNFRNQKLGPYQAYATDPKRSVVLKFAQRTVIITPDQPENFAQAVITHRDG